MKKFGDIMIILYDSLTGNVLRFVRKLSIEATQIASDMSIYEDFVLITFTTGFGEVPGTTKAFLAKNHRHLKGIASSGNKNFGTNFAAAANKIASQYDVPIILTFELSGTPTDVELFTKGLNKIEAH